jgi:hypothetical protein
VNELESRYRTLFVAYPWSYRREREDEMVATLLDGARPGQLRPDRREAAAILVHGIRCRFAASVELRTGVQIGGLVSLLAAVQMVAVSACSGVNPVGSAMRWAPAPTGFRLAAWAVAAMGLFAGTCRRLGPWRFAFVATALPMVAAGAHLAGASREELSAFYGFAAASLLAAGTRVWVRVACMGAGAAWGGAVYLYATSTMPGGVRWPSWLDPGIPTLRNSWLVLAVCVVGVVLAVIRTRFVVAAAVVAAAVAFAQLCTTTLGNPAAFTIVGAVLLAMFWALHALRADPVTT